MWVFMSSHILGVEQGILSQNISVRENNDIAGVRYNSSMLVLKLK